MNTKARCVLKFIKQKSKKGSGIILTMILVFIVITFSAIIAEFYRIYILQQEIEYQLQRSVNCAVEYAMGDSYRQDKIINLDITVAKTEFYKYLITDVGLDSNNRKFKSGKLVYTLYFTIVGGTPNPARFTVQGKLKAKSIFAFLVGEIEIPFKISSTNFRID